MKVSEEQNRLLVCMTITQSYRHSVTTTLETSEKSTIGCEKSAQVKKLLSYG